MSTTTASPAGAPSPTFLALPRSRLRWINNRPFYLGGLFLALAIAAFTYTLIHKMNMAHIGQAVKTDEHDPVAADGSQMQDEFKRRQMLQQMQHRDAATSDKKTDAKSDHKDQQQSHLTDQSSTIHQHTFADDARAAAWHEYYTREAELSKMRFERERSALFGDASEGSGSSYAPGNGAAPSTSSPDSGGNAGGSNTGGNPQLALNGLGGLGGASPTMGSGGTDAAGQNEKQRFQNQSSDVLGVDEDLAAMKHNAKPDTIMAGTPIYGVTVIGSNSDMPGMVKASINRAVCDSMTGMDTLIPIGSTLIGKADNSVSAGQTRIGVVWNRILFPDTSSLQIGSAEGADQSGTPGEHDKVDTHWIDKLLDATVISIGGAAAQLAQPQQSAFSGYSPSSVAAGSLTQQFSQLGQAYAQAGLSVPNTLIIRPGYAITALSIHDWHLPPYVDQRNGQEGAGCHPD